VLDSFVALPLAAKVSMAAVPGKGHVFRGLLWTQAESLVRILFLYSWGRPRRLPGNGHMFAEPQ